MASWAPDPLRPVLAPPRVRRRHGLRYELLELVLALALGIVGAAVVVSLAALYLLASS